MALPTVAYDTPVNREYLADLGVYALPGEVAGFAEAIAGLLEQPQRRRELGTRLRQRAIEHFSWSVAAETILNVYKDLDKRAATL